MSIEDLFPHNDNEPWFGVNLEALPKSGPEAHGKGIGFFFTGAPCDNGHISPRYAKGGKCVDCAGIRAAANRGTPYTSAGAVIRRKIMRATEQLLPSPTYVPAKPCNHGHMLRWVGTNNCVECDKNVRTARKLKAKETRLIKEYGMDFRQLEDMLNAQDHKCKICQADVATERQHHIDHCHTSGIVRGILCNRCNQAIGLMQDSPEILRSAANYLEDASARISERTKRL